MTVLIEVTSVQPLGRFRLRLAFNDGATGVVDARPYLGEGVFAELSDPAEFAKAFLDPEAATVAWPNGADLAPEELRAKLVQDATAAPVR